MSNLNTVIIDVNREFSLLVGLIDSLWDGVDEIAARNAIRVAFERGLEDGKLWIDEYATMRIAAILNGNDEVCFPLNKRNEVELGGDAAARFYDALCIFDSNLSSGLSAIHRSVTGYGRWNYSNSANDLCSHLRKNFGNITVTPKDQDAKTQMSIARAYCGHHASEAGSLPTPERLLKNYVEYSRDEQGMSLFRSLYSTVYSHALYCAQLKNTQILVSDLLPIYRKRDEPLNFDNGEEILATAMNSPFVWLVHMIKPFKFSSTTIYHADNYSAEEYQKNKSNESPNHDEQSRNEVVDELFLNIDLEIDNEDKRIDALVDTMRQSFTGHRLVIDEICDHEVEGSETSSFEM